MGIQCTKCKSMNSPLAEMCQTCGADLLPGIGRFRRISGIVAMSALTILFGYLGFRGLNSPAPLVGYFSFPLVALFAFCLWVMIFRDLPESARYEARAKRHLKIDPERAYADYTKAIRLAPKSLTAHQGRGPLYGQVYLSMEELSQEIEFLTHTLKTGRGEKLREELARQVVALSSQRINREEESGLRHESLNHILALLDFVETSVRDIYQFKTPDLSFGTGVTLSLRGQLRKNVRQTRMALYRAGLVKATGYCRRCKEDVEPDLDLNCSRVRSHGKVDRVRFFVPDMPPS